MGTLCTGPLILYLPNVVCYHWSLKEGYRSVFHNVSSVLNFSSPLGKWEPHFTCRHPYINFLFRPVMYMLEVFL